MALPAWMTAAYDWVQRAISPRGVAYLLPGGDVQPSYSSETALSTLARFPWVWTCVRAIADDSSTLPLVAVQDLPSGERRVLPDDPALRLIRQPGGGQTENRLRRQLRVDYELTGNAYAWRPSPVELIRLHPARMRARTRGIAHEIVAYVHCGDDGSETELSPDQVLHIADVSWEHGPASAMGESVIRCLHDDLTMEMGVKRLAAQQAQRGRPDVVFSSDVGISPEDQERINERWERSAKSGKLAFTVGAGLQVQTLSWSPREFEFALRSEQIRDVILAAFGVPAARAGLVTANYGTQKQQMRTYWEGVRARTKAFDDAFSRLAAPGVRVEHDFADVEALQVAYTERQQRVVTWVSLGAEPGAAAAYEGFDDAPRMDPDRSTVSGPSSGSGTTARPEEPQGDKAIGDYLRESAPRVAEIARAAEDGANVILALRWEEERAFAALVESGATPDAARSIVSDLVAVSLEAARAALAEGHDPVTTRAFGPARAAAIAARVMEAA